MTSEVGGTDAKVHIPSSESAGTSGRRNERPTPRTGTGVLAVVLVFFITASVINAIVSSPDEETTLVPPPFEALDTDPQTQGPVAEWSNRAFGGSGPLLALGPVAGVPVAISSDGARALVWERFDQTWQVVDSPEIGRLEIAEVTDDRVLMVGRLSDRSILWEWVDGRPQYRFESTSGSITGVWSVSGRLVVATSETDARFDPGFRSSRTDGLWIESLDGQFDEIELIGLTTVLAVEGDGDSIVIGGIDTGSRAAIGSVEAGRVVADPVPRAAGNSAVIDLESTSSSMVALVSNTSRSLATVAEIRLAEGEWDVLVETHGLVDISVIDDVVYGASVAGKVASFALDGSLAKRSSAPTWSGWVVGVSDLGGDPVVFGESRGRPAYARPNAPAGRVALPDGPWRQYHSTKAGGFDIVHVGSLEFAVRDGGLFRRAWNGERWHRVEGDPTVDPTVTIVETDWGFLLAPVRGDQLWSSVAGLSWERVPGSAGVHIEHMATGGDAVVGLTTIDANRGPTTEVVVVDGERSVTRISLSKHLVGLGWENGVGFFATVASPGSGHATSGDGLEWEFRRLDEPYGRVVGHDGTLTSSSGDPVLDAVRPSFPSVDGALSIHPGGVRVWRDGPSASWIYDGSDWVSVGFGVLSGLPSEPSRLFIAGSRLVALTEGLEGDSEVWVIDLP